jgi:hypothetical protein
MTGAADGSIRDENMTHDWPYGFSGNVPDGQESKTDDCQEPVATSIRQRPSGNARRRASFRNGFGTVGVDCTRQEQPLEWRLGTYRTPGTVIMLAVGFAALVAIVAATFWLSARAQMHSREVVAIRAIRVAAVELSNSILTAESSRRGYLYTQNEIYLSPYDGAKSGGACDR